MPDPSQLRPLEIFSGATRTLIRLIPLLTVEDGAKARASACVASLNSLAGIYRRFMRTADYVHRVSDKAEYKFDGCSEAFSLRFYFIIRNIRVAVKAKEFKINDN